MAKFEILKGVPDYPPYREAKGSQLMRAALTLEVGQCMQIHSVTESQAKEYRRQLFERVTAPTLRPPDGYVWRTSIRKLAKQKFVLLVWLTESTNPESPQSPESRIAEPESQDSESP